jgi:hypothetical protein
VPREGGCGNGRCPGNRCKGSMHETGVRHRSKGKRQYRGGPPMTREPRVGGHCPGPVEPAPPGTVPSLVVARRMAPGRMRAEAARHRLPGRSRDRAVSRSSQGAQRGITKQNVRLAEGAPPLFPGAGIQAQGVHPGFLRPTQPWGAISQGSVAVQISRDARGSGDCRWCHTDPPSSRFMGLCRVLHA